MEEKIGQHRHTSHTKEPSAELRAQSQLGSDITDRGKHEYDDRPLV